MLDNRKIIIDMEGLLADTGNELYVSGAGTVDGVAEIFDTGGGYTEGILAVDIATVAYASASTNHRAMEIVLQGSNDSTFATSTYDWYPLVKFGLDGSAATAPAPDNRCNVSGTSADTIAAGRYLFPFHNDFGGTIQRYLRIYVNFMGTAEASGTSYVDFKAWLSKR